MDAPFPPLRDVEIAPIEHEGETYVCLTDSSGYAEEQVILTPPAFFVAAHFDGSNGVAEVQRAFGLQYPGNAVSEVQIREIFEYLDGQGYLESSGFLARRAAQDAAFAAASVRPAHLADRAYPADALVLRSYIDSFFALDDGPGALGPAAGAGLPRAGIVSPHIDFARGGGGYAHAYAALHAGGRPDTVIVFGVAHAPAPDPFILCRKDFETPFGTLACDRGLVEELAAGCEWDPFALEAVHRCEHSIEFQAVMLAYLYGPSVRIVPVLCGAFPVLRAGARPEFAPGVEAFLGRCQAAVADAGRRVSVVAGADLAHVGRRFGDEVEADEALRAAVEARDREDLAHVSRLDAGGWYASVLRDDNARRVCGLNCVYAATRAMSGRAAGAELLHYDAAPDPAGGWVSFASLVAV